MTLSLRPTDYSSRWKILVQIILKLINKNRCIWKIKPVKIDKKYYEWIPARVATTTNYSRVLKLASCPSGVSNQQEIAEIFQTTPRTIHWWQQEGLPTLVQAHGGNQYGLHEVLDWVIRRRFGNKLVFEKKRLTKAQADKTKVQICLLQLQLLNSVEVASTRSTICNELREKVETTLQRITLALLQQRHLVDVEEILKTCWMSHWLHLRRLKWWC